ncbi:MAG TPA: ABC transporter substrate-binding protein [Acidimicrobiales bacterium]|nr:ABC transporter substrate-binding protein [Acidimicrobiales bacterium]
MRTVSARRKLLGLGAAVGSLAMLATTAVGSGSASASATKVPPRYASGLTMAMDATYPPDEFIQGGKIVGFDADLAYAMGKVLGVKVTLQDATFDTIIASVQDGKYAVGNSSFTDTTEREAKVTFIDYFSAGEGFYERSSSTVTFNGLASLCGHKVSVEDGTTEQTDAMAQAKKCHVTVLSFPDQNGANVAVDDGKVDVGFADSQVAAYIVHLSHGTFKLTGKPFETAPYGFIVAKGSGLAQPLLAAVKALMADGKYKAILDKWGVQQGAISNPGINEVGH